MNPFRYALATDAGSAVATVNGDHGIRYIAGGTNIIDLMKDDVERPNVLLDITHLPLRGIVAGAAGVRLGALATMADVADSPAVKAGFPVVSQALLAGASPQLRNMATIGGNIMQRTRCAYFRDVSQACNKRAPGKGCAAIAGQNRNHAVIGTSDACICTHPSDLAVALLAVDAIVHVRGVGGMRAIPIAAFHLLPGDTPNVETVLRPGDLIEAIELPAAERARNSAYVKVRDRASYEFALVSVAAAVETAAGMIRSARVAIGGVAPKPWRSHEAEAALTGHPATAATFAAAGLAATTGMHGYGKNDFKLTLTRRTVVRALEGAGGGMTANIGAPLDRVDGRLKVTGAATYSAEWAMPGVVYGFMVLSTIANGRIRDVDVSGARREPGVIAVMTSRNAPRLITTDKAAGNDKAPMVLQSDDIAYDRQPVAVVLADTFERAQHGASMVVVHYDVAQPQTTFAMGTPYKPQAVHGEDPDHQRGDAAGALATAAVKVDHVYTTAPEHHNPMEPHATIARWDGDALTVYDASQGIFGVRTRLAGMFGIPPEQVRVISKFIGGGFGGKGSAWPHVILTAMAAKMIGRPVKIVLWRPQMWGSVGYRSPTVQRVALGAGADGKLVSTIHEVHSQTSQIDEFVESSGLLTTMLYTSPALLVTHRLTRLNVGTPTYMRAPGESSGSFALESAMDELAYAVQLDPIELRLRNYAETDQDAKLPFSSKGLRECYRAGADAFDWKRRTPAPGSMRDGRMLVGIGMASATYPTNRSAASAVARIDAQGNAVVQSGGVDIGTGSYTAFSQVAADALGIPVEQVTFGLGDTRMPNAPNAGGSQLTASVGSAVKLAALAARNNVAQLALADARSPLFGAAPDAIGAAGGRLFLQSNPARGETYAAIIARNGATPVEGRADAKPGDEKKEYSMHAFGAQFAEVRVDPDLGTVRVVRQLGAFAAGRIINAKLAHSQFIGGMTMGLGMALLEETRRDDRSGRVMTANLAEYLLPVHADVPATEAILVEEVDPHVNEIGVKGIGEIGIVGAAAAIANAVYHATGTRIRDLPITPDKLL